MNQSDLEKRKVLFLVPDGVGVRNYLYSSIITELKKSNAKIAVWSTLPKEAFKEVELEHNIIIEYQKLVLPVEGIRCRLFKETATYARLIRNSKLVNNPTILRNWRRPKTKNKRWLLFIIAELIGKMIHSDYQKILKFENLSSNGWSHEVIKRFQNDLKKLNPSSIFITHQRVHGLMPICLAARNIGIPSVTAIYSWDNMPKARLAVRTDKYLVWSEYMKQEMATYHPEISSNSVLVTGTPQFEFYKNQDLLISRLAFAEKYGLDPQRKWICFSGDDQLTSPHDPLYLDDIVNSTKGLDVEILFRRAPVDISKRYDAVLTKYPDRIVAVDPQWNLPSENKGWGSVFPKMSDVALLCNISYHCELVINVGSTMAHDFAMFDKPAFYINYDQEVSSEWSVETIYKYQHFRTMEGLEAVGWLNEKAEIKSKILCALDSPKSIGKDRKQWMKRVVHMPVDQASCDIAKLLLDFESTH